MERPVKLKEGEEWARHENFLRFSDSSWLAYETHDEKLKRIYMATLIIPKDLEFTDDISKTKNSSYVQ